jgi:hypothetical protein
MPNRAVNCGPSGIMIMKSRIWVNWMPARVNSSQSSRRRDKAGHAG